MPPTHCVASHMPNGERPSPAIAVRVPKPRCGALPLAIDALALAFVRPTALPLRGASCGGAERHQSLVLEVRSARSALPVSTALAKADSVCVVERSHGSITWLWVGSTCRRCSPQPICEHTHHNFADVPGALDHRCLVHCRQTTVPKISKRRGDADADQAITRRWWQAPGSCTETFCSRASSPKWLVGWGGRGEIRAAAITI